MPYVTTPRAYASQVSRYRPGDPRHTVAAMRAALAMRAATAHRNGDLQGAAHALSGLDRLAGLGTVDTARIAAGITRDLTNAAGRLTPDARAIATGRTVAGVIATVVPIVGTIITLIASATNDAGVRAAARWINLILRGEVSPSFTEGELRAMATGCAQMPIVTLALEGVQAVATVALTAAGASSTEGQTVTSLFAYINLALTTICSSLAGIPGWGPASAAPPCAGPGVSPGAGTIPAGAAGCCPDLVFDPSTNRCVAPSTTTPDHAAMLRWQTAWNNRRNVEVYLLAPGVPETARANAQARDQETAAALCAAEQALLAFRTIPARGTLPSAATLAALRASPTLGNVINATNFSPASTTPRCFLFTPPAGGCPAGCSRGRGGGGGAGKIFAVALPAAAILWYMMK